MWRLSCLTPSTHLTVTFDITAAAGTKSVPVSFRTHISSGWLVCSDYGSGATDQFNLQFITRYVNSKGEHRCRVTTVARHWTHDDSLNDLISGFDQEAACVSMARIAGPRRILHCSAHTRVDSGFKMEVEEDFDSTRWLDRSLIRLSSRYGEYRKDDPQSFSLRSEMEFYPQFMFNLRRSQFVQVFGNSPDESVFFRVMLNRVSVAEAMVSPCIKRQIPFSSVLYVHPGDDSADTDSLCFSTGPCTSFAGCPVHRAGSHSATGCLLLCGGLPWLDSGSVEKGRLS